MDPLAKGYPWYTPYQFAGNKPIWAVDLDGLEESISTSTPYGQMQNQHNIKVRRSKLSPKELAEDKQLENKVALGVALFPIAILAGETAVVYALTNPVTTTNALRTTGQLMFDALTEQTSFGFGLFGAASTGAFAKFSQAEKNIIAEASEILRSKQLTEAIEAGLDANLVFGKYKIDFRPGSPFSGFTGYAENSFIVGGDVLEETGEELAKTVLHELWRLNNSMLKGGKYVSPDDVINAGFKKFQDIFTQEAKSAQEFGDNVIEALK